LFGGGVGLVNTPAGLEPLMLGLPHSLRHGTSDNRLLATPALYVNAVPARISLGGRSSLRHQDLREGSALEAFFFDDVQLQVLSQLGEWAVPRADRDRDRRQLVFVDEA
jgi:hypothetical protein